jgi:hypothetical protein
MQPVTMAQGWEMARKIGAVEFIAYSSLTRENLNELFAAATRACIEKPKPSGVQQGKGNCIMQ